MKVNLVALRQNVIISIWLFLIIIVGITPLISEILFRLITGINDNCILPTCKDNEISFDCLKDFFLNSYGFVFLTISIIGSLYIDIALEICFKKRGAFAQKKIRFFVCLFIANLCFGLCLTLAALNPISLKQYFHGGGIDFIFKAQIVIFILSFLSTFIAKKHLTFNS